MLSAFVVSAVSATFSVYPGFVKPKSQVEMVRDLGLVLEVTVKCPLGTGILTFSKVEKVFCAPDLVCYRDLQAAIRKTCG